MKGFRAKIQQGFLQSDQARGCTRRLTETSSSAVSYTAGCVQTGGTEVVRSESHRGRSSETYCTSECTREAPLKTRESKFSKKFFTDPSQHSNSETLYVFQNFNFKFKF
jgi:hypothetical protein